MESVSPMDGVDVLGSDAQHLRDLHGHGGAAAPDVGRAFDEADRAVGVDVGHRGGGAAAVEPSPGGDSSSPVGPVQGRRVMGVLLRRLQSLHHADPPVYRASARLAGTLLGRVQEPEVDGVHAEPAGQLVDHRLGGKGRRRRSRGAVCRGLLHVGHDVQGLYVGVGYHVGGQHRPAGAGHRRARKSPCLVDQRRVGGRQLAVPGSRHLDLDVGAAGGARALEHLGAAHDDLHGGPGLLGEHRSHRLQVQAAHPLAAESAAYLHRE